jgi:hypothetical protein
MLNHVGKLWLAVMLIVALTIATGIASAQAPEVTLVYHPGDSVRVAVSFKEPVHLEGGRFYFQLQGALQSGQPGFGDAFQGSELKKISDTEYEFAGQIPEVTASGTWRLGFIDASMQGVSKRYNFGTDFKKDVTIRIENPRHVQFPEIKDVGVRP